MIDTLKNYLKKNKYIFRGNKYLKNQKLISNYLKHRDYYSKISKVSFSDLFVQKKKKFNINFQFDKKLNILFFYNNGGWLDYHILPALKEFGYVETLYFKESIPLSSYKVERKRNGENLYSKVLKNSGKFDVIFIGGISGQIDSNYLNKIMKDFSVPIINFQFDDKQKFSNTYDDIIIGSLEAAKGSILTFTNAKYCVDWYLKEGCPAIYLAEGSNPDLFRPDWEVSKDIDVAFFGANYGLREGLIQCLRKNNIDARAYGPGWNSGFLSAEDQINMIQRTKILLSHEGIQYANWPACLKLRTFDYALCGSAIITSYNSEIGDWFKINDEILCYYNFNDAVDIIKYYINKDSELDVLRRAAYDRAIKEHTWYHRFEKVFKLLSK